MRFGLRALSLAIVLFGTNGIALNDARPQSVEGTKTIPLFLEKSDGEPRVRRPRETPIPTGQFTIKIDRKTAARRRCG